MAKSSTKVGSKENKGQSLLIVDLLQLPSKLSFRCYRVDIIGFLVAWGIVILLIVLTLFCARIGA